MNDKQPASPGVGVGIIVLREINGKPHIMIHQRKGAFGKDHWGTGGGHLELGESLMDGALRELLEEAGDHIRVKDVRFLCAVNITDFPPKHYVDINFVAQWESGEPINTEPEKMSEWQWRAMDDLPSPLLHSVAHGLEALRTGRHFFDSKF